MSTTSNFSKRRLGGGEWLLLGWVCLALASLPIVTSILDGSFPIFTVVWLIGPVVAVLRQGTTAAIGVRRAPLGESLRAFGVCLGLVVALMALVEPWSHTYAALIALVFAAPNPDTTFGWLIRFDGVGAWAGLALYSGLVTLFAEELCFRGWLLTALRPRLGFWGAIAAQATLFTLPNLIAVVFLPPLQGALYGAVYAWLAIGVVGGWAAARTGTIWPSLAMATLVNLALTALVR